MAEGKVLLVASQGADKLKQWLAGVQTGEIVAVQGAAEARRSTAGDVFALALINAPLMDETGLELAVDLAKSTTAAVVLLVKTELAPMISDTATESGVLLVTRRAGSGRPAPAARRPAPAAAARRRPSAERTGRQIGL